MTNVMGGTNLHTPRSIFQHMMGQQDTSQQPGPWTELPQIPPMSIPWSVPSMQQSELVRFTGGTNFEHILHHKRKLESPDLLDTRQTKQFITEEKMAAHFKELHISTSCQQQAPVPSTSASGIHEVPNKELNMELELDAANTLEANQLKTGPPRLVLSEELKELQQDPILPSSLFSKLKRPSMALVLWEPPSKHLCIFPPRDPPTHAPASDDDNNNGNNNNSEAIPNLNRGSTENSMPSSFEPMEL